jgi:5-methylcytosine-specific restriction protein A
MTETPLVSAQRLLAEAVDALRTAAGNGAGDDELLSVLAVCEATGRRLDNVVVDTVAALQRRGTFAERGYTSTAGALADLLGWERCEARRRVIVAEQTSARVGVDGTRYPPGCPPPPRCSRPAGPACATSR